MANSGYDIVAHPASVNPRALGANADMYLGRLRQALPDPTVLDELTPYFWMAEVSNDRMDSYYTRMSEQTLKNYRDDAIAGVSFQNSHRTNELGMGRSLDANFVGAQGNGVARLEVTFYTFYGLQLNEIRTDDFIRGLRTGVVKDVSVGFYGGRYICSICGRDMLKDWDCTHIPGLKYDRIDVVTGRSEDDQIGFAWVDGARLAEVSAVYEGSTPGAAVLKAVREAEADRLTPFARATIEQRYRTALPMKSVLLTGIGSRKVEAQNALDTNVNKSETTDPSSTESAASSESTGVAHDDIATIQKEDGMATDSKEVETEVTETPSVPEVVVVVSDSESNAAVGVQTPATEEEQGDLLALVAADVVEGQTEVKQDIKQKGANTMQKDGEVLVEPSESRALADLAIQQLTQVRTLLKSDDAPTGVRALVEQVKTLEAERASVGIRFLELEKENARLIPLADQGREYRAALIEETLAEGVRADGAGFPSDTYKVLLEQADLVNIRTIRDGFRVRGDSAFEGGRKTEDGVRAAGDEVPETESVKEPARRSIPDAAFRL